MREILFRAKNFDDEWVEGNYIYASNSYYIAGMKSEYYEEAGTRRLKMCEVFPSTVGQYTGMTDSKGTKIFEGDIIRCTKKEENDIWNVVVVWYDSGWAIHERQYEPSVLHADEPYDMEVIGNIHDNPELLEVKS